MDKLTHQSIGLGLMPNDAARTPSWMVTRIMEVEGSPYGTVGLTTSQRFLLMWALNHLQSTHLIESTMNEATNPAMLDGPHELSKIVTPVATSLSR